MNSSWQGRLQERRANFLMKSKDKLQVVHDYLEKLKRNPHDAECLKLVNQTFHQLAGAGGIYELTELCDLSIAAEGVCTRLLKDKAAVGKVDHDKLVMFANSILKEIDEVDKKPQMAPAPNQRKADDAGQRLDIVIADDNHELLIGMHRVFEEQKFNVRTVKSSSGARGALLARVPDALIVSTPLPDSSGYEIIQQLRSLPGGHKSAAIVLGENTNFHSKVEAIRAGADAFFEKPVDPKDVLSKVKMLVDKDKPVSYKILSVEDDPEQAAFIKSTLEAVGYNVHHIYDPSAFEEAILTFAPDLVLLDIMLGDINGHELARFIRQHERFATTPIIFLTTENQLNAHIESAQVGGDDHLIKPIAPPLLVASIAGRLERYSMLKKLMGRDAATQFLTYATFVEQVQRICTNPKKVAVGATLVQFDIDRLDEINERYGHPSGEKAIYTLASIIRNVFRQSPAIGRLGGDDFAVVVENLTLDETRQLVEHALETFAGTRHMHNNRPFKVTARAGLSWLDPGTTARVWMSKACDAVRQAREKGGNCAESAGLAEAVEGAH